MQVNRPQARRRAAGKIGPWAASEEPPAMPVGFSLKKENPWLDQGFS